MESVLFIGLDVHSKTISCCSYNRETGELANEATIANDIKLLWKYAKNVEIRCEPGTKLVFGYEAGCLGFHLAEQIRKYGYDCHIMAPTTIKMAQTDRARKTDRRDARALAQALGTDAYEPVYVPDQDDQQMRNYIRMREDHQDMIKRTKQRINSLVLKLGFHYDAGKSKWTKTHRTWLKNLKMGKTDREVLDEYLTTLEELEAKVDRFDAKITEVSETEKYKETVDRFSCMKGITRPIAMRITSEIGDFNRFATAGQFASYIGLTPSEHSSGADENKGAITKLGNAHVRKTLVEAAQSAIKGVPGRKSKKLLARQRGNSPKVIHYADKANARFITKFKRLMDRGKNRNTAVTAVAREMACFIWGMATGNIEDREKYDPSLGEVCA